MSAGDNKRTDSSLTLRKSFFDDLWPMILEENPCDTHSKNTSEYFVPERRFDALWAHTLLAAKGFKNYQKPIEFRCCQPEEKTVDELAEEQLENACEIDRRPQIVPLDQQHLALFCEEQLRQQLGFEFVRRQQPWYIPRPIYESDFKLNDEIRSEFSSPLDLRILQSIHAFQCKLMIIDAGADVYLSSMERWLKFCGYVQMIAVVHCTVLARRLLLFGGAFYTQYIEENLEDTWQEELALALDTGVNYAKELKLLKHCAQPFVFVFSHKRGMIVCDSFKVLRKF